MKFLTQHKKPILTALAIMAGFIGIIHAIAGDLSYTKLKPQSGDDPLIAAHRAAVAAAPGNYTNITATGTTHIACAELDRIVVGTAGGANTAVAITDGTLPVSTMSGSAQVSLGYGAAVTTGTINIVISGSAPPNITVITK